MTNAVGWLAAVLAAACCTAPRTVNAEATQFSARLIRSGPQGTLFDGHMYVADGRSRVDISSNGRQLVNIVDHEKGVAWTLFPDQGVYLEQRAPARSRPLGAGYPSMDPCHTLPGAECRRLGEERMAGRPAEKWEIRLRQGGSILTGTQWIDRERHTPLRIDMPGGQHEELNLLGMETVEGRRVEKWESIRSNGSLAPVHSFQWYDPELNLAVRQEMPGGYSSELKDIRVETQPEALFRVPDGYRPGMSAAPDLSQRP